jgi:hypothetical protein
MKNYPVFYYISFLFIVSISGSTFAPFIGQVKEKDDVALNNIPASSGMYDGIITGQPKVSVKTNSVQNITATTAECSYTITAVGEKVTAQGVCISKAAGPTITNSKFGPAKGSIGPVNFRASITGLIPNTKFYARAYATTASAGTVYGNELTFTTLSPK